MFEPEDLASFKQSAMQSEMTQVRLPPIPEGPQCIHCHADVAHGVDCCNLCPDDDGEYLSHCLICKEKHHMFPPRKQVPCKQESKQVPCKQESKQEPCEPVLQARKPCCEMMGTKQLECTRCGRGEIATTLTPESEDVEHCDKCSHQHHIQLNLLRLCCICKVSGSQEVCNVCKSWLCSKHVKKCVHCHVKLCQRKDKNKCQGYECECGSITCEQCSISKPCKHCPKQSWEHCSFTACVTMVHGKGEDETEPDVKPETKKRNASLSMEPSSFKKGRRQYYLV